MNDILFQDDLTGFVFFLSYVYDLTQGAGSLVSKKYLEVDFAQTLISEKPPPSVMDEFDVGGTIGV